MKVTVRLIPLFLAPFCLQGCLFIYLPGSVTSAISDSITGAEGQNCVGANAKVGDRVRTPGGGWATVKSLSGTSMRCTNPELPIRALLAFDSITTAATSSAKKNCDLVKDENGDSKFVCPGDQK